MKDIEAEYQKAKKTVDNYEKKISETNEINSLENLFFELRKKTHRVRLEQNRNCNELIFGEIKFRSYYSYMNIREDLTNNSLEITLYDNYNTARKQIVNSIEEAIYKSYINYMKSKKEDLYSVNLIIKNLLKL